MKKPFFAYPKNNGADQLCKTNGIAIQIVQNLYFLNSVAVQSSLCRTWLANQTEDRCSHDVAQINLFRISEAPVGVTDT